MILKRKKDSGFIFLEIIIAIAIISIAFISLLSIGAQAVNLSHNIQKTTQINFLIKEEVEALRSFRDGTTWTTNGLGAVNTGSSNPYYLVLGETPVRWNLVSGTETIDVFTRNIVFDKVSRDPTTNNIESVYNISHDDADTKKITVNIAWSGKIYQIVTYLTNWKND